MTLRITPVPPDLQTGRNETGEAGTTGESAEVGTSFLQTPFWGSFKRAFGWRDRLFFLEWQGECVPMLVLERKIARIFSFAYVPDGPALDLMEHERAAVMAELGRALKSELPGSCMFIRFDPPWSIAESTTGTMGSTGTELKKDGTAPAEPDRPRVGAPLLRAATDIQPPDTVLVDLHPDEDGLLAAMKPKWRYNIRLAAKKGVVIEEIRVRGTADGGEAAIGRFYRLYKETARRDRIALHPRNYYEKLAALAAGKESDADLRIWIARIGDEDIASIITLFMNGHAVYLYGASSDSHRNLMPAYALQWAAIRAARSGGCTDYDFYGIPPSDDPAHPMAGLYRFKTGFGGTILHKAGSWDYPCIGPAYSIFRLAEKMRKLWFKKILKMFHKGIVRTSDPAGHKESATEPDEKSAQRSTPGAVGEAGTRNGDGEKSVRE